SNSLQKEVDLFQIMDEVFTNVAVETKIKMNNRKILTGIADYVGEPERMTEITVAMDKLDKIGEDGVFAELREKGLRPEAVEKIKPLLKISGTPAEKLAALTNILANTAIGLKGIEELQKIFTFLGELPPENPVEFDLALARGLNYYTGAIFEVKAVDMEIGSICGGGRYDDLTGIFGLPGISGVGVSFGADRIYDVMNQLNLFPSETAVSSYLLIANFGEKEAAFCLSLLAKLRAEGIRAELYPDAVKLGKQIAYANSRQIPFVALVGENEIRDGIVTVKRLSTGEQLTFSADALIEFLKE
ncbi:MAG: histidine--tRNA ligase, partial [Bacteroidetes bacterium RBG_13_46_8]